MTENGITQVDILESCDCPLPKGFRVLSSFYSKRHVDRVRVVNVNEPIADRRRQRDWILEVSPPDTPSGNRIVMFRERGVPDTWATDGEHFDLRRRKLRPERDSSYRSHGAAEGMPSQNNSIERRRIYYR